MTTFQTVDGRILQYGPEEHCFVIDYPRRDFSRSELSVLRKLARKIHDGAWVVIWNAGDFEVQKLRLLSRTGESLS